MAEESSLPRSSIQGISTRPLGVIKGLLTIAMTPSSLRRMFKAAKNSNVKSAVGSAPPVNTS